MCAKSAPCATWQKRRLRPWLNVQSTACAMHWGGRAFNAGGVGPYSPLA